MEGFTTYQGRLAIYNEDHVDTDRIIPARFLSRVSKVGFGELLFCDLRGPEFPLDQPEASGASILVVGTNFGCGSSREHAVWAIQQAGFKTVIARRDTDSPGYSDIFRGNSANCGMLLVELDAEAHAELVSLGQGEQVTVDLPNQKVIGSREYGFDIAPATKHSLVNGLDLIGTTLVHSDQIGEYEAKMPAYSGRGEA